MHYFYSELGFEDIAQSICKAKVKNKFIILGDYKQGKTAALSVVREHIKNNRSIMGSIIDLSLNNDSILDTNDFAPFINFITSNESLKFSKAKARARIIFSSINKTTETIDKLFSVKASYAKIYSAAEVSLLEDLEKITARGTSVFLCDDVDKWDWASVAFLKKLMTESYNRWIKKSLFILTATDRDVVTSLFDIEQDKCPIQQFVLKNLSDSAVKHYLSLTHSKINFSELYEITQGNLGETCEFIKYFDQVGNITVFKNLQTDLKARIQKQVRQYSALDVEKKTLDEEVETVSTLNMINRSSIIGERFHRALLQEFTHAEESFSRFLSYALHSGIYDQKQKDIFFTYSSIYKRLNSFNKNNSRYHQLLAEALQKIAPSNFRLRAKELILSGYNDYKAAIAYFNYIINFVKKYQLPFTIDAFYIELLSAHGIYETLIQLQTAYQFYYSGSYDDADSSLPNRTSEPEINFQIDYLHCLILVNRNVLTSDYCEAEKILLPWVESETLMAEEPYLWLQATILYDEIMSETENGTKYNAKIINVFNKYMPVDLEFRIEYHDYFSKNNYTYKIDVQYNQTQQAVKFFRSNTWVPGKSLFARALTNHIANAIVLGKYEEGIQLSHEYFYLLNEYSEIKNYLFTVVNNYFIALIMSDEKQMGNAAVFANYYEKILSLKTSDKIFETLIKINYGLMLFFADNNERALEVYSELYEAISNEHDVDDYYRYFVINNYSLIHGFLNGNMDELSFDALGALNPYPTNVQFFNKHTQCLNVLKSKKLTKRELFTPMGSNILGPAWSFWGRPLLFTDIQYWSD